MEKIKYFSGPAFRTVSWAITYFYGDQNNSKFYRDCDDEQTVYLYDVLCSVTGDEPKDYQATEFDVVNKFILDGQVYFQIKVADEMFWTHGETLEEEQ